MKNKMGQLEQCPLTAPFQTQEEHHVFFHLKGMAPIQTLTRGTNELERLKTRHLHFDISADRCKNIYS